MTEEVAGKYGWLSQEIGVISSLTAHKGYIKLVFLVLN